MKVEDIMKKNVEFVTPETTVREVSRLIFGRGINGIPVCKEKKIIGFITERDILAQFYPSMQEYIEDYTHVRDFEAMEGETSEILRLSAEKIMNRDVVTIPPATPILRAQSLMKLKKISRLPVVDDKGHLLGIISNGDIFRAVVGKRMPLDEEQEFYDWLAQYYDLLIDWKKRLSGEIPDIIKLFKKNKVESVLDVASSTGEHTIALAKEGFKVIGIDTSHLIEEVAKKKTSDLAIKVKENIRFLDGEYPDVIKKLSKPIDAAIFMGNALSHVWYTDREILKEVVGVLKSDHAVIVLQILNTEKIFRSSNIAMKDVSVSSKTGNNEEQQAFVGFYSKGKDKTLVYTRAVFNLMQERWVFKGIKSTPIMYLDKNKITSLLKEFGFSKLSFYGGMFYGTSLLKSRFNVKSNDWLNVVATK